MYIEMPADNIDLGEVAKEPNSAVRMAIIQKFGFRRLIDTVKHRVILARKGNSLIEFALPAGKSDAVDETIPSWRRDQRALRFRVLHVNWRYKIGDKETLLPVPRLKAQFGPDCPENINDCEQVRRWTLGWSKEAIAVAET